jgi:hypothetical protein
MQKQTKEVNNGLKFGPVDVPTTPDEYDQLAKRSGAVVEDANDNIWYRGVLPNIWYGLAVRLNKEYGIQFAMKAGPPKKDGSPRQVRAQSDPQHVDMIAAQQGVSATTFQPFVDEVIREGYDEVLPDGTTKHYDIKFDPSTTEHVSGPAKPGKGDVDLAKLLIEKTTDLGASLRKIEAVTGEPTSITNGDGKQLEGEELVNRIAIYIRNFRMTNERIARAQSQAALLGTAPEPTVTAASGGKKKGNK